MSCAIFREQYSEFTDGFLDEAAEIGMIEHMSECEACRRLDAAYRAGSSVLRDLPDLAVSDDFQDKLQARILIACSAGPEQGDSWRRWPASALALVAILAVAGWQFADHSLPSGGAARGFVVRFAGDSSLTFPGRMPMIPVPRDSFRSAASPAASFQIAVDYMIVP